MNAYLELKLAWELYQRPPQQLATEENTHLAAVAARQRLIETKILATPEAAQAHVTPAAAAARLAEIRARYPDEAAFLADLESIDLDAAGLEAEIARDLRIEGVLERVAAAVPAATATEAEIFYRVNAARFAQPERRTLRHILITFNNRAEKRAAESLLAGLAAELRSADDFAAAAQRHSQCPTALDGGLLGTLPRGKLYAELDAVAFELAAGALAAPVETEVGLHLVRCDAIHPAATAEFAAVRERIMQALDERRRRQAQKTWLTHLN